MPEEGQREEAKKRVGRVAGGKTLITKRGAYMNSAYLAFLL